MEVSCVITSTNTTSSKYKEDNVANFFVRMFPWLFTKIIIQICHILVYSKVMLAKMFNTPNSNHFQHRSLWQQTVSHSTWRQRACTSNRPLLGLKPWFFHEDHYYNLCNCTIKINLKMIPYNQIQFLLEHKHCTHIVDSILQLKKYKKFIHNLHIIWCTEKVIKIIHNTSSYAISHRYSRSTNNNID